MKILVITDRQSGERKLVRECDRNYARSIDLIANRSALSTAVANRMLEDGQRIVSFRSVAYLELYSDDHELNSPAQEP